MAKAKKPRGARSYWLRDAPVHQWVEPWEPAEPFHWTPELLQFKRRIDELLAHFRQDGNRLHLFRAMILCKEYDVPVPPWVNAQIVMIWDDLFAYAENRGAERIRNAVPDILLAPRDRNRIGPSVFFEEHQAQRERVVFQEVTARLHDSSRPGLKMKQVYGEVGDLVGLKAYQIAKIYRNLAKQLDRQIEVEEIGAAQR